MAHYGQQKSLLYDKTGSKKRVFSRWETVKPVDNPLAIIPRVIFIENRELLLLRSFLGPQRPGVCECELTTLLPKGVATHSLPSSVVLSNTKHHRGNPFSLASSKSKRNAERKKIRQVSVIRITQVAFSRKIISSSFNSRLAACELQKTLQLNSLPESKTHFGRKAPLHDEVDQIDIRLSGQMAIQQN